MRGRIPEYQASNRGYLTVAVGCTGGQHRSVYIVDRLARDFAAEFADGHGAAQRPARQRNCSSRGRAPPRGARS